MLTLTLITLATAVMLLLAVTASSILGWASRAFYVFVDPRVTHIQDALPGANCGGCGYVGCGEYAEAVVGGDVAVDLHGDHALVALAVVALGTRGQALLAEQLLGGLEVAAGLVERLLAVHHPGAAALTQGLDVLCGE